MLISNNSQFVALKHGDAETLLSNRPIERAGLGVILSESARQLRGMLEVSEEEGVGGGGSWLHGLSGSIFQGVFTLPKPWAETLGAALGVGWNTWSSAWRWIGCSWSLNPVIWAPSERRPQGDWGSWFVVWDRSDTSVDWLWTLGSPTETSGKMCAPQPCPFLVPPQGGRRCGWLF